MSEVSISRSNVNVMELRAIPDLLNKKYFIPEYQRGYRWESEQVKCLLNDLLDYFKDKQSIEEFYCLQPIVVKRCDPETIIENNLDEDDWFEIIDGQQRLTTIRILCSIYDSINSTPGCNTFNIRYSTRPDMDAIYDSLSAQYEPSTKKWVFNKGNKQWKNLDSVYIYNAAKTVVDWFNEVPTRKNIFGSHFFNNADEDKSVQVVWYEDCGNKDARDIFNEINDLTVKLSCSELIRSLFLSSNAKYECTLNLKGINDDTQEKLKKQDKANRQRYVNTKWDEIEHRLSDERMKAFMSNIEHIELRNNIELLFDLIAQKYVDDKPEKKDPLYTFIYFNKELNASNASQLWQKVEKYYSILCGWMENSVFYHKVGYLNAICSDDSTISELLHFAETNKKHEMLAELDRRIKESVKLKGGRKLSSLTYQDKNDYNYIRKLLFLYNVELQRRQESQQFFPFELFKPLNNWTLEHIHAQNSECLPSDDRKVWAIWARNNADTLVTLKFEEKQETKRSKLIEKLQIAAEKFEKKDKAYTHKTITDLFDEVADLYNQVNTDRTVENPRPVHKLTNMALLSQEVNTSVGCSAFAVKRLNIISLKNKGCYFPIGTMNVFQKSYSKNQQLYEWSYQDRRSYMASLKWILRKYITID